jgi:hypothetical protein
MFDKSNTKCVVSFWGGMAQVYITGTIQLVN